MGPSQGYGPVGAVGRPGEDGVRSEVGAQAPGSVYEVAPDTHLLFRSSMETRNLRTLIGRGPTKRPAKYMDTIKIVTAETIYTHGRDNH